MFMWMSGFQNPLVHADFNMFMDEYASCNEIPDSRHRIFITIYIFLKITEFNSSSQWKHKRGM